MVSAMIDKAVPVVLRRVADRIEILMFRHPNAGIQIIKGTVEGDETPERAALRELHEESGVVNGEILGPIGRSTAIVDGECWHFYRCRVGDLPDHWSHHTEDDGGLDFGFFWQDLADGPPDHCHPMFLRALDLIRSAVAAGSLEVPS